MQPNTHADSCERELKAKPVREGRDTSMPRRCSSRPMTRFSVTCPERRVTGARSSSDRESEPYLEARSSLMSCGQALLKQSHHYSHHHSGGISTNTTNTTIFTTTSGRTLLQKERESCRCPIRVLRNDV